MLSARDNDIAVSGAMNVFIDELPKLTDVKTEGEAISQEVKVAMQRKVCTFQLTGTHYRAQRVWRCVSCKLTGSRGMCEVCRFTCHADHEVTYESVSHFFWYVTCPPLSTVVSLRIPATVVQRDSAKCLPGISVLWKTLSCLLDDCKDRSFLRVDCYVVHNRLSRRSSTA